MATDSSSNPPRKRGFLFKLGIVLISLVVLIGAEFNAMLDKSIQSIFEASNT